VSATDVPQENVRLEEEDIIKMAVNNVLTEEGWQVSAVDSDGKLVKTAWRGDDVRRRQVSVRVSHTSMGFAVATRVKTAVPVTEATAPAPDHITIDGRPWRLDPSGRDDEKSEERRLGLRIQDRWQELKVELRKQRPAP